MKQTNSAIKFLVSQYRSIFKRAYFKGLISAVVLTSGLAAGAANADGDTYNTIEQINQFSGDTITIGAADTFKVSGDSAGTINKNITITAAKTTTGDNLYQFTLQTDDKDFTVTSSKTLTVTNGGALNFGTKTANVSGTLNVKFGTLDFQSGSVVNIYGNQYKTGQNPNSSGNRASVVEGDVVNVAGTVLLKSNDGSNAVLQGKQINIKSGSVVTMDSSTETTAGTLISKAILGSKPTNSSSGSVINVSGAKILMLNDTPSSNSAGSKRSSSQIYGSSLTLTDSALAVSGDGSHTLKGSSLIQSHDVDLNNSKLYLENAANLSFNPQSSSDNGTYAHINGTVDINGGVVALGGDLVLNRGGTITIADGTKIFATQADSNKGTDPYIDPQGSIVLGIEHSIANAGTQKDFQGTTNPTLKISSTTLDEFFSGDGSEHKVINAAGTEVSVNDYAGKVILTDGARVQFTDTDTVKISDYSFGIIANTDSNPAPKSDSTANFFAYQAKNGDVIGTGKDTIDSSIRMEADKMAIEKSLITTTTSTNEANSSEHIIFVAKDLTLGSSTFDSSNKLGIKAAEAQNVKFVAHNNSANDSFVLQENLTLRSITGPDLDVAGDGTIQGNVSLSGSSGNLTIDGGNYTSDGTITVQSGSLLVGTSTQEASSSLNLSGALMLDGTTVNTITVTGKDADSTSLLDLTDADVAFKSATAATKLTTITVSGNATLRIDGDDATALLENASTASTGAVFSVNGGHLEVQGDLGSSDKAISVNNILATGSVSAGGQIGLIHTDSKLSADTLYLADNAAGETLSFTGNINVDTLNLSSTDAANTTFDFDSGTMTVLEGIQVAKNTKVLELGNTNATLNLGTTNADNTAAVGGGSVLVETLKTDGGHVNFQGAWTANKLDVQTGSMTVGQFGTVSAKILNAQATNGTASGLTIADGGSLSIAGTTNTTGDNAVTESGISLAANSVTLYGNLTLGSGVAEDITFSGDSTTLASSGDITKDAIDIQGGTLKIDFSESVTFSSDQLKVLKEHLFSGDQTAGTINGTLNIGNANIGTLNLGNKDENNRYDFDNVAASADVVGGNVTNTQLVNNAFTTADGSNVGGTVGAIHVEQGTVANIQNSAGFVNASVNGGFFVSTKGTDGKDQAADISFAGTKLNLENGGAVGAVTLSDEGQTINIRATADDQVTFLKSLSGGTSNNNTAVIAGNTEVSGAVTMGTVVVDKYLKAESVDVETLKSSSAETAGNVTTTKNLDVSKDTTYAGNLNIGGKATFAAAANLTGNLDIGGKATFGNSSKKYETTRLAGNNKFAGEVQFNNHAKLDKGSTQAQTVNLQGSRLDVYGDGVLTADLIKGTGPLDIRVGQDAGTDGTNSWEASAGTVSVGRIDLNGGRIFADPDFDSHASILAVDKLGSDQDQVSGTAGALDGSLVAGRNSVIAVGVETDTENNRTSAQVVAAQLLSEFADANGALNTNSVGAIGYVGKQLQVKDNADTQIVVDASLTTENVDQQSSQIKTKGDIYLGSAAVLAVDTAAMQDGKAAVIFDKSGASIYNASKGNKIVITGDMMDSNNKVNLFDDAEGDGIELSGETLEVRSLSGLFYNTYEAGAKLGEIDLKLDKAAAESAFTSASSSVRNTLIAWSSDDLNWATEGEEGYKKAPIHNGLAEKISYVDNKFVYTSTGQEVSNQSQYVAHDLDGDGISEVYFARDNSFLKEATGTTSDGSAAETVSRLGVYGGAAQAALKAGAATSDAISGRFGVGGSMSAVTTSANGQGAGMWVAPIYTSLSSDGFAAQGLSYGVDVDLYGLALGGDYTLANGVRFGAMFNLGSGDADGNGTASGVSNDFSYYGFGVYGGYAMDNFQILADVSYTIVDNDVEGNTNIDKVKSSFDASALSVGVTGQYTLNLSSLSVTPHAGLRYTSIDMDDYTVSGATYGDIAHYSAGSLNVFSIPVGVTLSKDIVAGAWTVKPSFDLTLTANLGDDETDGTVDWSGTQNLSTDVVSEVVDSFTYGATLGVAATNGNFTFGAGVNYTGASNADEYGIQATARFVF